MDNIRAVERQHRASIVGHRRKVFSDEGNVFMSGFATIAALLAIGATLAGLGSGTGSWFYLAGFLAAVACAFFMPVIFSLWNR